MCSADNGSDAVESGRLRRQHLLTVTRNETGLYSLDDSELTELGQNLFTTDLAEMYNLE